MFILGWAITYIQNEPFIQDNPVKRAFQGNNLCIGIDEGLANSVAVSLTGLALYPVTMFTQNTFYKMHVFQEKGAWWYVHAGFLVAGYILSTMFIFAPGTQPKFGDPRSVITHTTGFALGCFGYSFLRLADAMTFWTQYQDPWSQRYKAYFGLLVFSGVWILLNGFIIVQYLLTEDIAELLKEPEPPDEYDWLLGGLFAGTIPTFQTIWTLIAAVQPVLRVIAEPPDVSQIQIVPFIPKDASGEP